MNFEVVIPSRWNISTLKNICSCISEQSVLPDNVHVIIDKFISKDEFDVLKYFLTKDLNKDLFNFVCNLNYNFCPNVGVSYARNFGIKLVKSEYMYMIDDDNVFNSNFFQDTLTQYQKIFWQLWNDIFLSPSILYRKTWRVQSQWIKYFNPFLSKVKLKKIKNKDYVKVKMIWWNSLFGKTENFKKIMFDEYFKFVYEDLDFTWKASNKWIKIIVSNCLFINHMEREKSITERSFVWDPDVAYQKARNRIMLIRNNAWFFTRKVFFVSGLWIQTFWFIFLVIFFGKWSKKSILKSIIKWTYDWIRY